MELVIREAIEVALKDLGIEEVNFGVEHPGDVAHGDYATNVAMVTAKKMGVSPRDIAERFRAALEGKIPDVTSIEIAGPGFLNFTLSRDFFVEKIEAVNASPTTYGQNDILKGEEIIFEYTSPNLFKPLHIGNLVGNIVGESISRLMEYGGATLHRVNYPSDIGPTVAKGVWGLIQTKGDVHDINAIGEAYRVGSTAYDDGTGKEEIDAINRALYAGTDEALNALRAQGIATSRARLAELCEMLGTHFDAEFFESEVSEEGTRIVREKIGTVFEESEGAVIFRGERYGLHTRVFLNSHGLPTYEAKDMGNFARKQSLYPGWTRSYIVTGGEQREYFKVLIKALKEVFPESKEKVIENIATGFLTLTTGKMSSRKGNVLTGEDLLAEVREEAYARAKESRAEHIEELTEQVAVGAIKYQILRQAVGGDIVFDKARALSLEGDSGPYLMYTHARLTSILEKAKHAGLTACTTHAPEVPYRVEKLIYQFEEVVRKAGQEKAPHFLVTYLTTLASEFNSFYAHEQIVDLNDPHAPYKIALAASIRSTLKNGLWLLGIKAPECM
ncbi:arginine--tRNA ligase [Candidatus Kaiserbacteria bacterium]|nr:MAG: arginine--tRNA ligase [Candidatus Kaiserbacteria bacterium]